MLLVHAIHTKSQRLSRIQWNLQGKVAENTLCTTRKQYTSTIQNPNNNFVSIKSPKKSIIRNRKAFNFPCKKKTKNTFSEGMWTNSNHFVCKNVL